MLIASLLAALAAKAEEPLASCQERVAACERVLDKAGTTIEEQGTLINKLQQENRLLQSSLDFELAARAKEEIWYRDPKTIGPVAFVLGVALGAWAVGKTSK